MRLLLLWGKMSEREVVAHSPLNFPCGRGTLGGELVSSQLQAELAQLWQVSLVLVLAIYICWPV